MNRKYLFVVLGSAGFLFLATFALTNLPFFMGDYGGSWTSSGYYLPCWYGDSGSDAKGTNNNTFAAFYDVRTRSVFKKNHKQIGFSLDADKSFGWLTSVDSQGTSWRSGSPIKGFCQRHPEDDMYWKAAPPRDYAIVAQQNPRYWPISIFVNRVNYFIAFPCWYGAKGRDGNGADPHSYAGEFIAGPISELPTKNEVNARWTPEAKNDFCRSTKALGQDDAYSKTAPEAEYVKIEGK